MHWRCFYLLVPIFGQDNGFLLNVFHVFKGLLAITYISCFLLFMLVFLLFPLNTCSNALESILFERKAFGCKEMIKAWNEQVMQRKDQWKVDRELANHSLSSTASQGTSNIPFPCFLVLGCNRQAQEIHNHWRLRDTRQQETDSLTCWFQRLTILIKNIHLALSSRH